jgi:uncharacterized membrane protein YccC
LALYVAFWLQLESAYSAAVTVGILSLQTRGQACQKAMYRLLMTVVGVVVSIIIAGLFNQTRDLFVIAYASWLGLCVYVCGLLDGNRAYGVVLSGYTVAIVAVTQIDSPQSIFLTASTGARRSQWELPRSLWSTMCFLLRMFIRSFRLAGDTNDALFACHAVDLLTENQRAQDAIEDLEADRRPPCHVRTPIYRSRRAAARNGLRAFLAILIAAILLSLGGWPFASQGLSLTGVFVALSANTPSPRKFAVAAVIALPIAALLAGVTEFLILDGVDQFPLLAIGMAPSVLAGALLFTLPNAILATIGLQLLVFFPVLLSPANPQDYNPEAYLYRSFMAILAVILMFAALWTILPGSDLLRRRWYLTSARAELRDLLAGRRSRYRDDDALFRDADRVGQLAVLQPADGDERRDDLRQALNIFGLAAAARRIQTALAKLSGRTDAHLLEDGYSALAASDASRLREAAAALAPSTTTQLDQDGQAATADLIWAAFLIDVSPFDSRPTSS